jgi:hypothetical protein
VYDDWVSAIVITTLVLASMFTPVKNALQVFVDRRFKPEPEKTIELSEDYTLTLEQRVLLLEGRLGRMEVGADPRAYEEP